MSDLADLVPTPPQASFARGVEILDEHGERSARRNPAEQMRLMLGAAKRNGTGFDRAWAMAWENISWPHDTEQRREWKFVLGNMRHCWRDGYAGRDPAPRLRLLGAIEVLGTAA